MNSGIIQKLAIKVIAWIRPANCHGDPKSLPSACGEFYNLVSRLSAEGTCSLSGARSHRCADGHFRNAHYDLNRYLPHSLWSNRGAVRLPFVTRKSLIDGQVRILPGGCLRDWRVIYSRRRAPFRFDPHDAFSVGSS